MRTFGLLLLVGALLVWQVSTRAEDAVVLKACSYQAVRDGFQMPRRILPIGAIVKVLATHGAKAEVTTSGGDKVSVRLANLRMLRGVLAPGPATVQLPPLATPAPPTPALSPAPSPVQAGPAPDKAADIKPAPPSETDRRPAPVRCSHLLKNGQQCSRMTTNPNGLCWQHGGD